jgi:hypothetical protein
MARFKTPPFVLVPLEFLAMIVMGLSFAATLSLALKLGPLCAGLDASSSPDLAALAVMCPLSQAYAGVAGGGS